MRMVIEGTGKYSNVRVWGLDHDTCISIGLSVAGIKVWKVLAGMKYMPESVPLGMCTVHPPSAVSAILSCGQIVAF